MVIFLYFDFFSYYNKTIMARPSKLNAELIEKIGEKLSKGLPLTTTCDLLGITTMSISAWMRQGEEDFEKEIDSLFAELSYTIKKARAEFEEFANDRIVNGAVGWQGTAWWLERTRPQYMPKQEITAGDDKKVTVVLGGKFKEVKKNDYAQ